MAFLLLFDIYHYLYLSKYFSRCYVVMLVIESESAWEIANPDMRLFQDHFKIQQIYW